MINGPTDEHLRRQAQEIVNESEGDIPTYVNPKMVQAALEESDVDLDEPTEGEYDVLFEHTRSRLDSLLDEVRGGSFYVQVYGDERIEDSTDYFTSLSEAVQDVEYRRTDDHGGWEFEKGRLRLVDYNNGHGAVIHAVGKVSDDE